MSKILVIEDNLEVRENLCEILELANYEVISASNGFDGVNQTKEHLPDLILCDVMMPELDGFGVLKILNGDAKTFDIPFIFLTAKTAHEDFRKGMGLGADDYLTKPFDDIDLLNAIEMRLKKHKRSSDSGVKSVDEVRAFFSEARAEQELSNLSKHREVRKYNAKDVIYEPGQTARWLYFVVSGQVKIFQVNELGKDLITHIHKEGDFFGYYPLIQEKSYTDYASALENAELKLIPKKDFSTLLYNQRDFAARFIKMIAQQVQETEQLLIDLAYSSVRRKVANALLLCMEQDDSQTIRISREDLASLAGTAKETLIRTLSDFRKAGLLSVSGVNINIKNPEALRNMPQ